MNLSASFWVWVRSISLFLICSQAHAECRSDIVSGVRPMSQNVYWLHMALFWICVVISVVVFGVLIYALIHYRKSRGATPVQFHQQMTIEIMWAVIPFLILVAMAVPAVEILFKMNC